ncbi:MAG: hypothetical protein IBJ18_14165, partial [Phycisphaerales bacterium]|nr:hypothetical protein [Phycisphaerales bacterium]
MSPGTSAPNRGAIQTASAVAAIALLAGFAGTSRANLAYQASFSKPVGDEWSIRQVSTAPSGEKFLGTLAGEKASLKLGKLADHSHAVIALDLIIIGNWKGSSAKVPHKVVITIDGKRVVLDSTFANDDGSRRLSQSYPYDVSFGVSSVPGSGAYTVGALGYGNTPGGGDVGNDSVYRLVFTIDHGGPTMDIDIEAQGLPEDGTAVWGIDNVAIELFKFNLESGAASLFTPESFSFGSNYGSNNGIGPLTDDLIVTRGFALFCVEIFDWSG